jgi:hypothetical protein
MNSNSNSSQTTTFPKIKQQHPFREAFKLLDSDTFDENQLVRPAVNIAVRLLEKPFMIEDKSN